MKERLRRLETHLLFDEAIHIGSNDWYPTNARPVEICHHKSLYARRILGVQNVFSNLVLPKLTSITIIQYKNKIILSLKPSPAKFKDLNFIFSLIENPNINWPEVCILWNARHSPSYREQSQRAPLYSDRELDAARRTCTSWTAISQISWTNWNNCRRLPRGLLNAETI